jgi:hypothetical protein
MCGALGVDDLLLLLGVAVVEGGQTVVEERVV